MTVERERAVRGLEMKAGSARTFGPTPFDLRAQDPHPFFSASSTRRTHALNLFACAPRSSANDRTLPTTVLVPVQRAPSVILASACAVGAEALAEVVERGLVIGFPVRRGSRRID